MARGCNTLVISQNGEQPLSYLAPFLTNILLSSVFTCQTSSPGVRTLLSPFLNISSSVVLRRFSPVSSALVSLCWGQPIAVVLCSGWEKAQVIYEQLEELKVNQSLHSIVILLGLKEEEAKASRIPKNCESASLVLLVLGRSVGSSGDR